MKIADSPEKDANLMYANYMYKYVGIILTIILPSLVAAQDVWERTSNDPFLARAPRRWAWGISCINPSGTSVPVTSVDYKHYKDVTGASSDFDGIGWSEACVSLKTSPVGGHSYVFETQGVFLAYLQSYNHYVQWDEFKQVRVPMLAFPDDPECEVWGCIDIMVKYNEFDELVDTKYRQTSGTTADKKNFRNFYEIENNPGGPGGGD